MPAPPQPGLRRQAVESLLLLAIAVTLFRAFGAEGYLISTGSMAPTLLGAHRRVVCPDCYAEFACSASQEGDAAPFIPGVGGATVDSSPGLPAHCPNCGRQDIPVQTIPRNEGDQLLVQKTAYVFRDPRRWEVVVFANPADPRQAYVKRVVGLPGEQIAIRDGEVYANGVLQRKPAAVQRAMAIPVFDLQHQPPPDSGDWQPRWRSGDGAGWSFSSGVAQFAPDDSSGNSIHGGWLEYKHWLRSGGAHRTDVPLAKWPDRLAPPHADYSALDYRDGVLTCRGVLSELERRLWLSRSDDEEFVAAITELSDRSHLGAVVDDYGYNAGDESELHPLKDLWLRADVTFNDAPGRFTLELGCGDKTFQLTLHQPDGRLELIADNDPAPLRTGKIPLSAGQAVCLEFSVCDHQVCAAADGRELFAPWTWEDDETAEPGPPRVRVGAAELSCRIDRLILSRDVYYTDTDTDASSQAELGSDEFFVLGDNSPVSVDSRRWESPAVPRAALIGKPLLVHLPSLPGEFHWGGRTKHVRLPDASRIRWIR